MKKINYVILFIVLSVTMLAAQSKYGIGINALYTTPTGDFGDVYKSGFGGIASLTYEANESIQLSLNLGYEEFGFNNDKYNQMLVDFFGAFDKTTTIDIQSKLNIIPVMIGGKYFLTSSSFRPYAAVDLGMHIVSVSASSIIINGESITAVASQSTAVFAWGIGAGFLYKIGPKIDLDVNAKINGNSLEVGTSMSTSSSNSSSSQSSNSTATYFSISAGLLFAL